MVMVLLRLWSGRVPTGVLPGCPPPSDRSELRVRRPFPWAHLPLGHSIPLRSRHVSAEPRRGQQVISPNWEGSGGSKAIGV